MTLRKIAETLRDNPGAFWDTEFISPLLDAVVEKETEIQTLCCANYNGSCEHRQTDKHKNAALNELGLKGVWPVKEGE